MVDAYSKDSDESIRTVLQNPHTFVNQYEAGRYELGGLSINIKQKNDISPQFKRFSRIDHFLNGWDFDFL